MRRDYASTFGTEALVLISALLIYRAVAFDHGSQGFAAYAVARRALTLLLPLCVVGLDVALPRMIAYASAPRAEDARRYLAAAIPIAAAGVALVTAGVLAFPASLSQFFFGSADLTGLVAILPLMLAGATGHVLVYGHLRGRGRIQHANAVMALNHALAPLAALLLTDDVMSLLAAIGAGWLVISGATFLLIDRSPRGDRALTAELFRIGAQRVPGDLIQLLFLSLPVILAAQIGGLEEAGVVAFGITALGMIGSALTPIGFVLLPVASRQMGAGSVAGLRAHVGELVRWLAPLVVGTVVLLEIFAEEIVAAYLGPNFARSTPPLRIILVGAIPWSAYIVLRAVVDARHERAVNARNLGLGLATFVVGAAGVGSLGGRVTELLFAFVLASGVLGALTALEAYRALRSGDRTVAARPPSRGAS